MPLDDRQRDFYLRKEQITALGGDRMGMPFWDGSRSHRFIQSRRKFLASPVADFGCGPGPLSILTARMGFDVTGYDCVPNNIENATRMAAKDNTVRFVECFLAAIPAKDGTFRSGMLKEVLEHIVVPDIPGVLAEIHRVLAPGAALIVTVPRESLLSKTSTQHVTFFANPRILAEVLKRNGFEIVNKEYNRLYRRIAVIARVPGEAK